MRLHTGDGWVDLAVAGLSRQDFRLLVDAHPPRRTDRGPWNESTFPPAIISACTGCSLGEATTWWNETPEAECFQVYEECLRRSSPGSYVWAVAILRANPRRALEVRAAMAAGMPTSQFLSWPHDDQDLALASIEIDADRCPGCGTDGADRDHPERYEVVVRECIHCRLLGEARTSVSDTARDYTHVSLRHAKEDEE